MPKSKDVRSSFVSAVQDLVRLATAQGWLDRNPPPETTAIAATSKTKKNASKQVPRTRPSRCRRCQVYGHSPADCTSALPQCGVCAGDHHTEFCIEKLKKGEPVVRKCAVCGTLGHSAPSYYCKLRPAALKKKPDSRPSRPQASKKKTISGALVRAQTPPVMVSMGTQTEEPPSSETVPMEVSSPEVSTQTEVVSASVGVNTVPGKTGPLPKWTTDDHESLQYIEPTPTCKEDLQTLESNMHQLRHVLLVDIKRCFPHWRLAQYKDAFLDMRSVLDDLLEFIKVPTTWDRLIDYKQDSAQLKRYHNPEWSSLPTMDL